MQIFMSLSLIILTIPALLIMVLDLLSFNKKEFKFLEKNKKILPLSLTLISLASVLAIVEFILYFIFKGSSDSMTTLVQWAIAAPAFAMVIAVYSIIFFISQYVLFGVSEEGIKIFGESIIKEKIDCIIKDKETNNVYVVFVEGTRKVKKIKLKANSVVAKGLVENYEVLETKLIDDVIFETKFKEIWNEKRGISVGNQEESDSEKIEDNK